MAHRSHGKQTQQVAELIAPGGRFYINDGHLVGDALFDLAPATFIYSYFEGEPGLDDSGFTYIEGSPQFDHRLTANWNHGITKLFLACRVYECGGCGMKLNRDVNAIRNLVEWCVSSRTGSSSGTGSDLVGSGRKHVERVGSCPVGRVALIEACKDSSVVVPTGQGSEIIPGLRGVDARKRPHP